MEYKTIRQIAEESGVTYQAIVHRMKKRRVQFEQLGGIKLIHVNEAAKLYEGRRKKK